MGNKPNIDKRIKRSKDALKRATLSLMEEKDFKTISITEIAERADFNRGTFYAHYRSKEDLLREVVMDKMNELIETLNSSHTETDAITLDEVYPVAVSFFNHFWENANYYRLMLDHNVLPGFQDYLCETINNHVLKYIKTDSFNPNHQINPEILSYERAYSILGIVVYWFKNGLKYTPNYMAEQLVEISTYPLSKVMLKTSSEIDK